MIFFKKPAIAENKRFRAHPWHGLTLGEQAPEIVNCYIEMVPTDTVKYELDKETGILKVDRPQKYSSLCPTLYGFLPMTYAGDRVAKFCIQQSGLSNIKGDGDPLDICVLTEKTIVRGDLIVHAIPIGGFRLIDGREADDKIISVMVDDFVYGEIKDITELSESLLERLRHYFLTYKDTPGKEKRIELEQVYGREEAFEVISLGCQDYHDLKI